MRDAGSPEPFQLVLCAFLGVAATGAFCATHNYRREATGLDSLGTGRADQQMLKLAQEKVAEAYRLDPSVAIADISQRIGTLLSWEEL